LSDERLRLAGRPDFVVANDLEEIAMKKISPKSVALLAGSGSIS
jgi:hypothetical protein